MSHELDFMNLHKALERPERIQYYASTEYQPDFLTLFFYQTKIGQLKFKQINDVKFHFFQIPNTGILNCRILTGTTSIQAG